MTPKFFKWCKMAGFSRKVHCCRYNQNFSGVYCTCHRPYPDPEDPVADAMIQCVLCEDWFHGRHLTKPAGSQLPSDDSYSEMICQLCHGKYHASFLHAYAGHSVTQIAKAAVKDQAKVVIDEKVEEAKAEGEKAANGTIDDEPKGEPSKVACVLTENPLESDGENLALFMVADWRKALCQCDTCAKMYADLKVSFLTSYEDTVHHYEEKAKESGKPGFLCVFSKLNLKKTRALRKLKATVLPKLKELRYD